MTNYKNFFGFKNEPFAQNIAIDNIYTTAGVLGLNERFLYTVKCKAISVVTGDVGSGKSTGIRYVSSKLHPSEYKIIPVIATTGSMNEILRQIAIGFGLELKGTSMSSIMKTIRNIVSDMAKARQTPVLIIDEAHLMRVEVFAQIHILNQFDMDSNPLMPTIFIGQNTLIDKLKFHTSRPLASRVIGRTHFEGLKYKDTADYLKHHLEIAGIKEQVFSEQAILPLYQDSKGLLRKTNLLAKGGLIAAAKEKCQTVSAEHIRIASTEII